MIKPQKRDTVLLNEKLESFNTDETGIDESNKKILLRELKPSINLLNNENKLKEEKKDEENKLDEEKKVEEEKKDINENKDKEKKIKNLEDFLADVDEDEKLSFNDLLTNNKKNKWNEDDDEDDS